MTKKIFIIAATMFFALQAHSGGVSDGGGGTTNPLPVDVDMIAYRVGEIGRVVLAWTYRQESKFSQLSPSEKVQSSYAKFFGGPVSLTKVVKETVFEVRLSGPCFDANGQPKEGSTFASQAGALCLSPYLMAPKLTQFNFEAETAALMIHELSHVLGASEAEAEAIQKDALLDLAHMRFLDVYLELNSLVGIPASVYITGGKIADANDTPRWWITGPMDTLRLEREDVDLWVRDWIDLRNRYFEKISSPILYSSPEILRSYTPMTQKIEVVAVFICMNDEREEPSIRKECQKEMAKLFGTATKLTARETILRRDGIDLGADFDLVMIQKPESWDDAKTLIIEVLAYVDKLVVETTALAEFTTQVYITN
ncbi:hypothetical protein [Bdellovibrio sp. HCB337]|uniref:hypothetical protein n=1 Tax=Bdellovibrio sp. HCB337 TaxID=3394358 RepID=UPI0039A54741